MGKVILSFYIARECYLLYNKSRNACSWSFHQSTWSCISKTAWVEISNDLHIINEYELSITFAKNTNNFTLSVFSSSLMLLFSFFTLWALSTTKLASSIPLYFAFPISTSSFFFSFYSHTEKSPHYGISSWCVPETLNIYRLVARRGWWQEIHGEMHLFERPFPVGV